MTAPRLCYIHIYKCGGSSMRRYIVDHLATPETRVIDQWAYAWERDISPPDGLLGNVTRSELLRLQANPADHDGPMIVLTHSFFYELMKRWPGYRFATLLRDPVERLVSQFHFQRRAFEHFREDDLPSWLDTLSSFVFNLQTAALCGAPDREVSRLHLEMAKANLHALDFVGFVEEFGESLRMFDRIFGTVGSQGQGTAPALNVTADRPQVTPQLRAFLTERCALDVELLAYARRLFRARLAAHEITSSGDPDRLPPSLTAAPSTATPG